MGSKSSTLRKSPPGESSSKEGTNKNVPSKNKSDTTEHLKFREEHISRTKALGVCSRAYKLRGCGGCMIPLDPREWSSMKDETGRPMIFSNAAVMTMVGNMARVEAMERKPLSISSSYIICDGRNTYTTVLTKKEKLECATYGSASFVFLHTFEKIYPPEDDRFDSMKHETNIRSHIRIAYYALARERDAGKVLHVFEDEMRRLNRNDFEYLCENSLVKLVY